MLALDVLVSFIQAYVFTLLSTLFISAAQESGHHEHKDAKGTKKIKEQQRTLLRLEERRRLQPCNEKL